MFYSYISVFAYVSVSLCLCVFLLVFVCIYVLPVASVLSAFVMYLVWLCFSKTISVIHCFIHCFKGRKFARHSFFRESNLFYLKIKILNGSYHAVCCL